MTSKKNEQPSCYGDLETVFPMGREGLRETPPECMACTEKTDCLRKALTAKKGLDLEEEMVDRAYSAGMLGFMERWSRKKMLQREKSRK